MAEKLENLLAAMKAAEPVEVNEEPAKEADDIAWKISGSYSTYRA
jgi:hypothetical protein